jgi:dipeptidyl aminopeptidase/acylaminoacyl peptidase
MRPINLFILIGTIFFLIGGFIWLRNYLTRDSKIDTSTTSEGLLKQAQEKINQTVVSTVISNFGEFDRMTVPYLQKQNFEGSAIEIDKLYQTKATYKSYLASYKSEGLKINGLLTIPTTEKPEDGYPAIVFIHGYIPPSIYNTTEKYVEYLDYLARNGFVVFKIDLRGHGNSEGEPGGAYYSSDYIYDALNAAGSLQKHSDVNPNKIGIWGHSMAGNVTLRSIAASDKIKAAVIWAGAVYTYEDMAEYGIDDNSYRPPEDVQQRTERQAQRQRMRDQYGDPDLQKEFWKQISPIDYITNQTAKIQIHHAVNDTVVPIDYTRNLKKLLSEKDIEIETFEYTSGGHNITSPAFGTAMQRTVEFYKQNL